MSLRYVVAVYGCAVEALTNVHGNSVDAQDLQSHTYLDFWAHFTDAF